MKCATIVVPEDEIPVKFKLDDDDCGSDWDAVRKRLVNKGLMSSLLTTGLSINLKPEGGGSAQAGKA